MAKYDMGAARKQAESAGLLGGSDIYKLKEGDNRVRLMSECLPHQSEFKGKPTFKWLCYILDRRDQKVKPFFMPHKIYKSIEALQINPEYAFSDVPMPYDLMLQAKGAGTIDVEYNVVPARRETPLTDDELVELDHTKPLRELQQALRDKQAKDAAPAAQATQPVDEPHADNCICDLCVPF